MKHDSLVDAIQQLRAELTTQRLVNRTGQYRRHRAGAAFMVGYRVEPERPLRQIASAQIAGHDDYRVSEVHGAALAVGEPAVLQYLEEQVEHVRVGLFDFVEQDHPVRPAAHRLGQLARVVIPDVAGRRADEPRHRVALAVLRHVQTHHVLFVGEQELGQRPAQFRFAHAGGAQEDKTAVGPLGVIEAGAGAADSVGHGVDGLVLTDYPLVQMLFHVQQALGFALHQLTHRDAGPVGYQLGDVLFVHHQVWAGFVFDPPMLGVQLLFQAHPLGAMLGRPLVVGHLVGPLLKVQQFPAAVFHLLHLGRQRAGVDAHLARRFVDEVDGLVGQFAVGDVAVAQAHRRFQRIVGHSDLVMGLVARFQRPQDGKRLFLIGFFQVHRLEPPGQRRVFLDVLAVFVQRGGADGLQLAPGEGGFEHVAGVQPALAGAGSHQRVHFVQEHDDLTVGRRHLVDHRLQAFLEFAAELGPGH